MFAVKKRLHDGNYFDYNKHFKCGIQLSFRLEWTYKAENYLSCHKRAQVPYVIK